MGHLFFEVELSLYNHEQPLEEIGKLEYLPVPSSHDWEIANTSTSWVCDKFVCSDENNCKLAEKSLGILLDIILLMSESLN